MERVNCSACALRRPLAVFTTNYLNIWKCCNPIGQLHRQSVASERLILFQKKVAVDLSQDPEKNCG